MIAIKNPPTNEPQILPALASISMLIGAISKDKRTEQGGKFYYRGIDDVMNALHPLLADAGVTIIPEVLSHEREERTTSGGGRLIYSILRIKYTFYASDGSNVSAVVIGEAMDSGDKASNKAMSVAFKYACFQVFCIPTEEMEDPDASIPPQSVPKEYNCCECGKPFAAFTSKDGRQFTAGQVYHMSESKYGRPVCGDCVKAKGILPISKKKED